MLRKILFFSLLCVNFLFAQPDSLLIKGIRLSYNLDFTEAEKYFNLEISRNPRSEAPFYFLARNYFWKFLGNKNEENSVIFNKYLQLALERANTKVEKATADEWTYYYLASAYLMKSAEASFKGKSFDAFWNGKKAAANFKRAIEINPNFNDALFGLGVLNYALSFVPGVLKIALDLTGLNHNKEKALSYFRKAFENSFVSEDEAAFHLSKVYFEYIADYDSSLFFINKIVKKYPRNILFKYQKALVLIEKKDLANAENLLRQITASGNKDLLQTVSFSYFLIGDILFKQNNFEESIRYYEKFFNTTRTTDYLGYANLRAAIAYAMIGNKDKFARHLQLCSLGNEDIQEDAYANFASEYYSSNGFGKEDSLLQILRNYYESGNPKKGLKYFEEIKKNFKNKNYINEALLLKALCEFDAGNFAETINISKKLTVKDFVKKPWLNTVNLILLANSDYFLKKPVEAKKYLELAEESNNSFFANKLASKINRLKRLLHVE